MNKVRLSTLIQMKHPKAPVLHLLVNEPSSSTKYSLLSAARMKSMTVWVFQNSLIESLMDTTVLFLPMDKQVLERRTLWRARMSD